MNTPGYYPIRFKEILRNYSFGDRWIVEKFSKPGLPANHRVAETWEICDRPGESSEIINGHFLGLSLSDLIQSDPEGILGADNLQKAGSRFPLLIKLLDASKTLGEQAHHDDALAEELGLKDPGKTEAWYMLFTRPNATIHCGQKDNHVTKTTVRAAILNGTIRDQMRVYSAQPGDSFLLYAGTMHYSPGGVLFYEIMQNSDVYIGLNKPAEHLPRKEQEAQMDLKVKGVHLEKGFDCKTIPAQKTTGTNIHTYILACRYFALEKFDLKQAESILCDGRHFNVLTVIQGLCTVEANGVQEKLASGQSCLLPASSGNVTVRPLPNCVMLNAYVPDILEDIIKPLRKAGFSNDEISALGGRTRLNDIDPLLIESIRD
jgi:mannose-6-phosphate isomerase